MEDTLRYGQITALVATLVLGSSCSWYGNLSRSLVDDNEKSQKRSVPGEQYDQLLVKFEELSKKYEELKESPNTKSTLVDELQHSQVENFAHGTDTETVDLFASQPMSSDVSKDLESQLSLFRRGMALKGSNPGEATKIFQQLENQGDPAVKVRAKLQVGELLLGKGQYDLALQVFEDIISRHAHSGIVLDALRFSIVCAEKLGIQNKKEQYASMLSDVFESN
jgi:hypothetical protein